MKCILFLGIFSNFLQQELDKESLLKGSSRNSSISFSRSFPAWPCHTRRPHHWWLSPWRLWPLKTALQFLNTPLPCFWAFAYAASSLSGMPLSSIFFFFGKLLISPRSRSHASPIVKPLLHVYDTFLWNFSSHVWLCVHFSLALWRALMQ